jgi:hypothetical protein
VRVSTRAQNEESLMKVSEKITTNFYINPTAQLVPELIGDEQ